MRVLLTEPHVVQSGDPSIDELHATLVALYGTDFGVHDVTHLSRFTDATRQAAAYRERRVLLAGDAAHVHSPVGGQGLNLGVQDAVNLGWKLAQVVRGSAPDSLLDSHHRERHPVGARVLQGTMSATALQRGDVRSKALRETMDELSQLDEPRSRDAARMSGLDIRYELGDGHPLLGRRVPDLDVITDAGPRRVFALLHEARPVLLDLGAHPLDITPWADRVKQVAARRGRAWELPVIGAVAAHEAVLIRPDGYVAWVGVGRLPARPRAASPGRRAARRRSPPHPAQSRPLACKVGATGRIDRGRALRGGGAARARLASCRRSKPRRGCRREFGDWCRSTDAPSDRRRRSDLLLGGARRVLSRRRGRGCLLG